MQSRIPRLAETKTGAIIWLTQMYDAGLQFHYDDLPEDIYNIKTNEKTFTDAEVAVLNDYVTKVFELLDDPFEVVTLITHCNW